MSIHSSKGNNEMTRHISRFSGAAISAVLVALSGNAFAQSPPAPAQSMPPSQVQAAPPKDTPLSTVEALHAAFGNHHARALHTKGVILEGTFTPAPEARSIVKEPIFSGGPLPIIARFSLFAGDPDNARQ
jgi:catalase